MRGKKRRGIFAAGVCLLLAGIGVAVWLGGRTRLNVVLVTLDTTRADRIGCYGYSQALTPALDSLAREGVLFEHARTPYPLTLPAHASILTGSNPPEHGLHVNGRGALGKDIPVLTEALRRANYETGAFLGAYVLDSKFGLDRGFEVYEDNLAGPSLAHSPAERHRDGKIVLDLALEWLQQRVSRPFFCWIHLYDPHSPYDSRKNVFGNRFEQQPYDAGIAYVDLQVKRLLEFLQSRRLSQRTLVVVVGDHGEGLMDHNEDGHGYELYDTTLRVPLLIAGPPLVKSGTHVPTPVSLVDLMPTILDCLDLRLDGPVTGRSLKPALSGGRIESLPLYAESDLAFMESRCAPLRSVITDRWKYIQTTRPELYDLVQDPGELHNLADTERTQRHESERLLSDMHRKMEKRIATEVNLTADERRILASLGYATSTGSANPDANGPAESAEPLRDVKDMLVSFNALTQARELLGRGQTAEATDRIRAVLAEWPRYSTARLLLGDVFVRQKRFTEAAEQFAEAVRDQPDNAEAQASLGNVLAAQGHFAEAAPHYRRALEINPTSASGHYYFAFTLIRLGQVNEGLAEFEEAIRYDPQFVDALVQASRVLAEQGRIREAVERFERAARIRPGMAIPPWLSKQVTPSK